jgi:trk system potassium uptake protein
MREWNSASAFVVGASLSIIVGASSDARLATRRQLTWAHGMVIVALAWLVGAIFAAIPMYLSGRFSDPLAALFEAMSGLTTTGMSVIHDLDHTPVSEDFYRHLLQFAGGQGIVIVVLSLFAAGGARIARRCTRPRPATSGSCRTSSARPASSSWSPAPSWCSGPRRCSCRCWWPASAPTRAFYHAINLFFASFDTGGFSVMQASMMYYHSVSVEIVVMLLMIAGTMSFGLHFALWNGNPREVLRHLETRTLAVTSSLLFARRQLRAAAGRHLRLRGGGVPQGLLHPGVGGRPPATRSTWARPTSPTGGCWPRRRSSARWRSAGWPPPRPAASRASGWASPSRRWCTTSAPAAARERPGGHHLPRRQAAHPARRDLAGRHHGAAAVRGHLPRRRRRRAAYGEFDITQTLFESVSVGSNIGVSIGVVSPTCRTG